MQEDFDPAAYGRHIAGDYDDTSGLLDPTAEIELLSELSGGLPILEFGIGTGRLAIPLAQRGHRVVGFEGAPEMAAILRSKAGGEEIPVIVGDFSQIAVEERFGLVALVMNTIYALPDQESQVRCFENAARHLRSGGVFVVDAWIPDPGAFRDGRAIRLVALTDGAATVELAEIHPAAQRMNTNKVFLRDGELKIFPANHRYAWPAELDLMARLAGMRLKHRWQDWVKTPFGDVSRSHVSVWEKVG
jgi:SAM-dependent methyltransferase